MSTPAIPAPGSPSAASGLRWAQTGFRDWIDRAVAVSALGTALAALLFISSQFRALDWVWLLAVGGTLASTSLLMPVYAWSARGMRLPATLYGIATVAGLWTWPLAWVGGPTGEAPFLWPCIGLSTLLLSIVWGNRVAVAHNLLCFVAYLVVRLQPEGGGTDFALALQDTLVVAVQPLLLLALFSYVRGQVARVDERIAEARRSESDAAVRAQLVAQRSQLDAVIHDEVMTTLVAAARSTGVHDPHVTDLAQHAVAALNAQAEDAGADAVFPPTQVARLLRDVVASVSPGAAVEDRVDPLAPPVPQPVVESLAQATREAVLNAEKHAQADTIRVAVTVFETTGACRVEVEVADDGVGFDVEAVPERRLGIRLSLVGRMRTVDGAAEVTSEPGRGTSVRLSWEGAPGPLMVGRGSTAVASLRNHPLVATVPLMPIRLLTLAALAQFTIIGLLQSPHVEAPWAMQASTGLLWGAMPFAVHRFGLRMSRPGACALALVALSFAGLNAWALPPLAWTMHDTWFMGAIGVIVVLLRAGDHRAMAWATAALSGVMLLAFAWVQDAPILIELASAMTPLWWLIVVEMLIAWMHRASREYQAAEAMAAAASEAGASSFARLVVREVWLSDLRTQVGGMLDRLLDPDVPITDADRASALALEGRLRDGIKAANFSAPALATAIMDARLRGVTVTLVDNRGTALPDAARRTTLRHLEHVVRTASSGRIVARTAPEGYDEAVTIVEVDEHGSRMTKIDNDGMMAVNEA